MRVFKTLSIIVVLSVFFATSIFAQDPLFTASPSNIQENWKQDEILVKFKRGLGADLVAEINRLFATTRISQSLRGGYHKLRIPENRSVQELIAAYRHLADVEYAEPNYIAKAHAIPNDPLYPLQWNLNNSEFGGIHMEQAWDISTGNPNVLVAVLDSGIAYENYQEVSGFWFWRQVTNYSRAPDLNSTTFVQGYDFVNSDNHPNDDEGHGTHVTGTIAQSTDNGSGVAGVAHHTAIMPVKVLDSEGSGSHAEIAEGIYFATDNGANIINLSLGSPSSSTTLRNALAYAYNNGVTIICSSGNDGFSSTINYPAAYDDFCIAVGATRYDEAVAPYSNRGASLDITAPGGDLNVDQNNDGYSDGILQQTFSENPNNFGYWFFQGTSMAAPHVSGVAALLIASGVATTPDEIREVLQTTAEDKGTFGWDSDYGWGILDATAALNYSPTPNVPPVADGGGPYFGNEDEAVLFDGSASFDPDNGVLTYSWNFGDGGTGSGSNPSHTYLAGGDYTVSLTVHDGIESSSTHTTTASITEVPDPPIAVANGPYAGIEQDAISFSAAGSYDPEGEPLSYQWSFGDGASTTGRNPVHTYLNDGTYTVTLVVNDGTLDSAPATTTAEIEAINLPPTAEANGPYVGTEGISVTFDASGSKDPESVPLSYQWDFGDGTQGTGLNPTHIYGAGGTYDITLTVSDGIHTSAPSTTTAQIQEVNIDPVANAGPNRTGTTGGAIQFNASSSYDSDGSIVSYEWNFGDGSTANGVSASHAYSSAGQYTVTLTVTDNQGGSDTVQILSDISDPATEVMHIGSIDLSMERLFFGLYVRARGTVTILDKDNFPVPGASVSATWSNISQTPSVAVTNNNGQAVFSTNWMSGASTRFFTLTVNQVSLTDWLYDPSANVEASDTVP